MFVQLAKCIRGCQFGDADNCSMAREGMACPYGVRMDTCGACFRVVPVSGLHDQCCRECNDSWDGDVASSTDRCPVRGGC